MSDSCLSSVACLPVFACLSVSVVYMYICLSFSVVCLSPVHILIYVYNSLCQSIYSTCIMSVGLSIRLSAHLCISVCVFVCLYSSLCVDQSVCLSVCQSISSCTRLGIACRHWIPIEVESKNTRRWSRALICPSTGPDLGGPLVHRVGGGPMSASSVHGPRPMAAI